MFSAARAARLVKNALRNAKIIRKMPISVPPCLIARPESYREGLLLARNVSPLASRRTEFSGGKATELFGGQARLHGLGFSDWLAPGRLNQLVPALCLPLARIFGNRIDVVVELGRPCLPVPSHFLR